MNKKSIRNKPSQPVQKTLPAAVHAAAMSLDGETPGTDASEPLVTADVPAHDLPAETPVDAMETTDAPDAPDAPDAGAAPAKADKHKPAKPGKPVTLTVTLPATEAQLFDALREQYALDGDKLKKSTLLRAALLALAESDEARVATLIAGLQAPAEDKPAKSKSKK